MEKSDQVIALIAKMQEMFGEDGVANPEHFPKVFEYQVKLAEWMLEGSKNSDLTVIVE